MLVIHLWQSLLGIVNNRCGVLFGLICRHCQDAVIALDAAVRSRDVGDVSDAGWKALIILYSTKRLSKGLLRKHSL